MVPGSNKWTTGLRVAPSPQMPFRVCALLTSEMDAILWPAGRAAALSRLPASPKSVPFERGWQLLPLHHMTRAACSILHKYTATKTPQMLVSADAACPVYICR